MWQKFRRIALPFTSVPAPCWAPPTSLLLGGGQVQGRCGDERRFPYTVPVKITPLDIRQRRFESSFNGLRKADVEGFLEVVAAEFEELVKVNIALREELKRLQLKLEQHLEREQALQETLVTAQRLSEDIKSSAKKEAEFILTQAEHQAEKIVQSAHQKLVQVVEDINELKRQRVQFESQVRGVIEAHSKLLEAFRQSTFAESEWERIDDNVSFLAPKKAGSSER